MQKSGRLSIVSRLRKRLRRGDSQDLSATAPVALTDGAHLEGPDVANLVAAVASNSPVTTVNITSDRIYHHAIAGVSPNTAAPISNTVDATSHAFQTPTSHAQIYDDPPPYTFRNEGSDLSTRDQSPSEGRATTAPREALIWQGSSIWRAESPPSRSQQQESNDPPAEQEPDIPPSYASHNFEDRGPRSRAWRDRQASRASASRAYSSPVATANDATIPNATTPPAASASASASTSEPQRHQARSTQSSSARSNSVAENAPPTPTSTEREEPDFWEQFGRPAADTSWTTPQSQSTPTSTFFIPTTAQRTAGPSSQSPNTPAAGADQPSLSNTFSRGLRSLQGHLKPVRSISFSSDGSVLFSASEDGTVRVWDAIDGTEISKFHSMPDTFQDVSVHPGKNLLAASSATRTLLLDPMRPDSARVLDSLKARARFSPDGRFLAGGPGVIELLDCSTGESLIVEAIDAYCFDFSADSQYVAYGSHQGLICTWNARSSEHRSSTRGHQGRVDSLVFAPNNRHVASAGQDNLVKMWRTDFAYDRVISNWTRGCETRVEAMVFADSGSKLIYGMVNGNVVILNAVTGHELESFVAHSQAVQSLVYSQPAALVASASRDGTIRIWSLVPGAKARAGQHHGKNTCTESACTESACTESACTESACTESACTETFCIESVYTERATINSELWAFDNADLHSVVLLLLHSKSRFFEDGIVRKTSH
ncbi:quinon protein alcohol dehydrogenase-like superfamily [Xylariales sp. PMI_506]|nr:quinon protein alcohol dehydrogenase-like superfamily [Xylariales sp. PMI_506]